MPYVLTLKLETEQYQEDALNKRIELSRNIYNACLGKALKLYNHLKRNSTYKSLLSELSALNKEIAKYDEPSKDLLQQRQGLYKTLNELRIAYGLSEYQLHAYVKPMQHHFKENIDSHTAQKLASRAWAALSKVMFGDGKKVHFKKYGQLNSVESKTDRSGIIYRNGVVKWKGLSIPVLLRETDTYAQEALTSEVKYSRILRKPTKSGHKFYIQLILEGVPPGKKTKDGINQKHGTSPVGIDPSLQSIAVASKGSVRLVELAPSINKIDKELTRLQRKLDRSRRATNPNKYNADGTIKKVNRDKWVRSNNYIKLLFKLKALHRHKSDLRHQEHNQLSNWLLTLGTDIRVEKTDFRALAKKAKEASVNEKTGKYNSRKRFGKSISTKAPAMLFEILNRKLCYIDKSITYINPWHYKASQYNHVTDDYEKKSLSERWTDIAGNKVQRDLYSAFLVMNSKNENEPDRDNCFKSFDNFLKLHDEEITRLNDSEKLLSSFGIKRVS